MEISGECECVVYLPSRDLTYTSNNEETLINN
jgi:hypothetical protein